MILITPETKLHSILDHDPNVITVLNRFGIRLGVGDKSVGNICSEHAIDTTFFVSILNAFVNESYFPEKVLLSVNATKIIDYLKQTNANYHQFQLPNIERHFNLLIAKSNTNNNLELMLNFFIHLKKELIQAIRYDKEHLFPFVARKADNLSANEILSHMAVFDSIEQKLSDLKSMFIIHLSGEYDENLCLAVVFAIIRLEKDIIQNNRIRTRILLPYIKSLI